MKTKLDSGFNEFYGRVILEDGSTILFRPITEEDAPAWMEFYQRLSARVENLRLHLVPSDMNMEDARRYCHIDYVNQFTLVAEAREEGQKYITAVGRYTRIPDTQTAEISFIVLDSYQGKGIGAKIIEWLAAAARKQGIDTFESHVVRENTLLLAVFQTYGFHMKQVLEEDVYHITFPLTKTTVVENRKDERAAQATLKSLGHIFKPCSVAVVGASNRTGAMGQLIVKSLLQGGYKGDIYPINAKHDSILSLKAYPSVRDTPGDIDLAIIATPSSQILNIVDECGRKKVKGIIVIADGFSEKDEQGAVLEREMVDAAFGYGMRIIGPNCMGVINTDPDTRLKATFGWVNPEPGNISFVSQSGALGQGILEYAISLDIGFANFVSVGNRADIAATDLIQYWEKDPATDVILMYLESFDNPALFSRVSRRASLKKPILAIKGGSTPEGSRATQSHTGAMATPGIISDALLREAGIVEVNSVNELFDSAVLLANQPVPKGRNIAVISNGGGPGILAADACIRNGLRMPQLSDETRARIKEVAKREININNPVDLTAGVSPEEFEGTLRIFAEDPNYDAILLLYVSPSGEDIPNVEKAIASAASMVRASGKPLLVCFIGMMKSKGKVLNGHLIPYYSFPEEAIEALTNAVKYHELKTRIDGSIPVFPGIKHERARQLIRKTLTERGERPLWLTNQDMNQLFRYYGVRFAESIAAVTPKDAVAQAVKIGFPVVVKLDSTTITHKTDVGGVVMNIETPEAVHQAYDDIRNNLKLIGREDEMQGVTIQRQVQDGVEVMVGVKEDPLLGHVVMFGMGGIMAELMNDTAVRLHPLTDMKTRNLIDSVKVSQLLKGYRGTPSCDIRSIEDLLLRISVIVKDIPQITEMDLNPVKVQVDGQGYWIVDSRILVK